MNEPLFPFSVNVHPQAHVDPAARIGEECVIQSGAYLGPEVELEAKVHVGANVTFVDGAPIQVKRLARIGANATVYSGVVIATKAEVRPGSVVTRSVPPNAIVEGNPANIVGYVGTAPSVATAFQSKTDANEPHVEKTPVAGVTVHHLPVIFDLRGNLTVGEFERQVPFAPKRYFLVFGVPSRELRGEHAHYECHQFLICIRGSCAVVVDDGTQRVEVTLDAPNRGLYLPPMTWATQYKHSLDALLMVFASDYYDPKDYIRDYATFMDEVSTRGTRRD